MVKQVQGRWVKRRAVLDARHDGYRCDRAAAELFSEFSRNRLVAWIRSGALLVDGARCVPRRPLSSGSELVLEARLLPGVDDERGWRANDLDVDVRYEDNDILVVDKSAGMVVHPAAGHRDDTLVNALLDRYPELAAVKRAGIVHRLDKDTSGLLVIARHARAYDFLVASIKRRTVERHYDAVVVGKLTIDGCADFPVGRDPYRRVRMAVLGDGRPARTHYRVKQVYRAHTHLGLRLDTGRTHQIRVHMAHLGYPLVGDKLYGAPVCAPRGTDAELATELRKFPRQALHASRIGLVHPADGRHREWQSELPDDMAVLLRKLAQGLTAEEASRRMA